MVEFQCDHGKCKFRPYMERFDMNNHSWCYLCKYHYLLDLIKVKITRDKSIGYAEVDTDRELAERNSKKLWDLEGDIIDMKKEIDRLYDVLQENMDVMQEEINELKKEIENIKGGKL